MKILNIKIVTLWAAILTVAFALAVGVPSSTLAADPELVSKSESGDGIIVAQASKDEDEVNDPLETVNRFIFNFNDEVFVGTF